LPSTVRTAVLVVVTSVLPAGCGVPRDPEGTLDRVRGGTLRAGVSVREPWTRLHDGRPAGVEAALLREFADELGARVEWTVGSESELFAALERRELDVVVGGLTEDTPWRDRVGLTGRYLDRHVMAVPPGENGWLMCLERFLYAREERVRELLHTGGGR
jgi:ABC-type amino acid transport substrate-binding protein